MADNDNFAVTEIFKAMAHAKERHEISGKYRGRFPCPKCKTGTVFWFVSRHNKHTHGACNSPQCIAWME